MKKSILSAVSIMAITLSTAAMAENNVPNTGDVTVDTKAEAKADWNAAKETVSDQAAEVKADTKAMYETAKEKTSETYNEAKAGTEANYQDAKAKLFGEGKEGSTPASLDVKARTSAAGMIGKPVNNAQGEKIATVSDIIVDKNGRAQMVVVSDGGFAGIGDKLAAFDYGLIVNQNADGDVFMPLTEDLLSKVSAFSYDSQDVGDNVRLIPADGYSVSQLMKANLQDQNGKKLATVENITFDGDEADNIIVSFDQMLGLGGEKAAFDFDDVQVMRTSADDVSIRLNARQSAEFEAFKQQQEDVN